MIARLLLSVLAVILVAACAAQREPPPKALAQPERTLQLGVQAWRDDELFRARELFASALWQYRSIDHVRGQWDALTNLASVALVLEELDAAEGYLAALRQIEPLSGRDARLLRLQEAQLALLTGEAATARRALDALLADPALPAGLRTTVLIERGRVAARLSEPVSAWTDPVAARLDARGDPLLRAAWLRLRAEAARQAGDSAARQENLQAALEVYRQALYRPGIAMAREALGELALELGAEAQAREHFQRALDIQLWLRDRVHARRSLERLAGLEDRVGHEALAARYRRWASALDQGRPIDWRQWLPESGGPAPGTGAAGAAGVPE